MFTRNEFFFFWLPGMIVASLVFSLMVVAGTLNMAAAILLLVFVGIALKFTARMVNPSTDSAQPTESEGEPK